TAARTMCAAASPDSRSAPPASDPRTSALRARATDRRRSCSRSLPRARSGASTAARLVARPVALPLARAEPQRGPHRIHTSLRRLVHHHPTRPRARESLLRPLPRGVETHLGPVRERAARMVQHINGTHREARIALGVEIVERYPPRLARVAHVHVLVHHHK